MAGTLLMLIEGYNSIFPIGIPLNDHDTFGFLFYSTSRKFPEGVIKVQISDARFIMLIM